ncbi:MAG: uroporphyrinogen decarboxylase [Chloroflexi bacterium]|nr:uroporphyrinogen decarboxylase [Chloroflexota bacterium]MCC6895628.1 uroporphyrinogen decarboxylase [Anaerolineae bacterium]
MNKRERLEKSFAGEATDRTPIALWRHWPGDDQRAADLARSTIEFQQTYNWDFVKITPAESFSVLDYGYQDEWEGNLEGTRVCTKRAVTRSLDWTTLRPLDPSRGALGRQTEAIRLITDGLRNDETPIIQTLYSPLTQAAMIGGRDLLVRHIRTNPDRIQTALNAITESTLRFIEAIRRYPIDGIYFSLQIATHEILTEEEYRVFGIPYDRKILEALPDKWWFNMLQLEGESPMFRLCSSLPAQAMNWRDQEVEPDLSQAKLIFNGAVCGGLSHKRHLHLGTPATIREQIRAATAQVNNRRFILATGSTLLTTTPLSNIRAVQDIILGAGR